MFSFAAERWMSSPLSKEKQWGRSATELPAFIIKRLPFRFTYDNNYFNDEYQGIPKGGYNELIHKLLEKAEVRLNTNYFSAREELDALADKVLFTGCKEGSWGQHGIPSSLME